MRKTRIIAFICALIMLMSVMSLASAEKKPNTLRIPSASISDMDKTLSSISYRLVENGEKVTFLLNTYSWSIYEKNPNGAGYNRYEDIVFDCEGKVKAKSSVDWIQVDNQKFGFILNIESNFTMKNRTGKVTVTGSGFKATLTFKQNGQDQLVSVKRSKKKVTAKFKLGPTSKHILYISAYKTLEDGTSMTQTIKDMVPYSKNSVTFTVKKGWNYQIGFGPGIENAWGGYDWDWNANCSFFVDQTTGSETYYPYTN